MKISLIAAMDKNNAIGYKNELLWHLPDDFNWFKEKTKGKPMVMGRNTMLSLGKPLPNRLNIVVSSKNEAIIEGFIYAKNLEETVTLVPADTEELMVIGGGKVYAQMLHKAHKIYITKVHNEWPNVDTFFPHWPTNEWEQTYHEIHPKDEKHAYSFEFLILERKLVF
ncbi:MAG: dihydrofolate reductase [Bacteroidetes bacterium]|nr:dihydrofolate reductase [Bacteroidota bacterium]